MGTLGFDSDFLIGAAIGSGNTGLAAERGGADFLLALNAGRLRNMGAPSIAAMLPICDASSLTAEFASQELLAQVRIPVLLGVNVWGPTSDAAAVADQVRDMGFAGISNFPSCMHFSRPMQHILARAGRGIEREVEQLRIAQEAGLLSLFYCATRVQARLAADAGIGHIVLNLGWNVGGVMGHRPRTTLEEVATTAREIGRLIKRINPASKFMLEGGPIATPEDLGRIVSKAPIDGYVGGSTIERMPLEVSVADQIHGFRQSSKRSAALDKESARLVTWARSYGFVGRSLPHVEYLRRLRAVSLSETPLLILSEDGLAIMPTINALANPRRQAQPRNVVQIDVGSEDAAADTGVMLFGDRDTIATRRPALADDMIGILVIRHPERLPDAIQKRLASALRDGIFRAPSDRRSLKLQPRVVLVVNAPAFSRRTEPVILPSGFDAELGAVFSGNTLRQPPLRERIDDLEKLIEAEAKKRPGAPSRRSHYSSAAMHLLTAHLWPGNEAELQSVLGRLAGRAGDTAVQPEEVAPLLSKAELPEAVGQPERDRIVQALWRHGFNRSRAAEALGISRKTLYNKIKRFGLSG